MRSFLDPIPVFPLNSLIVTIFQDESGFYYFVSGRTEGPFHTRESAKWHAGRDFYSESKTINVIFIET